MAQNTTGTQTDTVSCTMCGSTGTDAADQSAAFPDDDCDDKYVSSPIKNDDSDEDYVKQDGR